MLAALNKQALHCTVMLEPFFRFHKENTEFPALKGVLVRRHGHLDAVRWLQAWQTQVVYRSVSQTLGRGPEWVTETI